MSVLKGYPQSVPLPSGWEKLNEGLVFMGWTSGAVRIPAGATYTFSGPMTLTALWYGAEQFVWAPSSMSFRIPESISTLQIYAIGGGGGGGGAHFYSSGSRYKSCAGGGGGAGETVIRTLSVSPGTLVKVEVGEGGSGGTNRRLSQMGNGKFATNGGGGDDTIVYVGSNKIIARGGMGGRAASKDSDGAGGSQYVAGGAPGKDGGYASPNVKENAGKGGADDNVMRGGGGGAAGAFRYRVLMTSGTRFPSEGYLESKGGDGMDWGSERMAEPGEIGGGGGSGYSSKVQPVPNDQDRAGVGGNGAALLVMFRRTVE